jgi:hypothetical protein
MASSLGMGVEVIAALTPRFEVRGAGNYLKLSLNDKAISDISYDVAASWRSGALLGDLYLAGPLRLTGGIAWNGNQLTVSANPTVAVDMGDTTYQASDIGTIDGKIDFKKVAPYLGLGLAGRGRISPVMELGVVFQGAARVSYTATTNLTGAAKTVFDQSVNQEVANIQSDLNFFKYYPHVALGLTIRM